MRLALHVSPSRTSFAVGYGDITARIAEDCDAIAILLREVGAVVEVLEEPATPHTEGDFSLVFARDL